MTRRRRRRTRFYESLVRERFQPPRPRRHPHEPDDSPTEVARRVRELKEAVGDEEA